MPVPACDTDSAGTAPPAACSRAGDTFGEEQP